MQLGCIRTSFGGSSGSISPNFGDPCLGKEFFVSSALSTLYLRSIQGHGS